VQYRIWHKLASHGFLSAFLLIGVFLFSFRWAESRQEPVEHGGLHGLGLVLIFTCQCFLVIFLRSDETHFTVNSTVVFLLVAYVLRELYQGMNRLMPGWKPFPAIASIGACLAALSIPYVWSMKLFYAPAGDRVSLKAQTEYGIGPEGILMPEAPRAAGLRLALGETHTPPLHHMLFVDMNNIINFIRANTGPDERIFLLCGDQTIYFLAERESVLQKENYFVYLSNVQLIDHTYTARITDEEMRGKIMSSMPRFIVRTPRYADTIHFGLTWPTTHAFIQTAYEPHVVFGEYEILKRRRLPSALP
jgi:hypothetical protein